MLTEKTALEVIAHKERPNAKLVDARTKPDGSVEVFLDGEEVPSYKLEIVVTDLKRKAIEGNEIAAEGIKSQ